tara:strand:- start:5 stop:205 length:201 start_codon:yes stop_codon:yes gene_type:complete
MINKTCQNMLPTGPAQPQYQIFSLVKFQASMMNDAFQIDKIEYQSNSLPRQKAIEKIIDTMYILLL